MAQVGGLWLPDALLDEDYARGLVQEYFRRDSIGYVYSGAMFDTYPADPASGITAPPGTPNEITDGDLIALSMLGIRVTGYEALIITQDRHKAIQELLASIPADAHIEGEASDGLLAPQRLCVGPVGPTARNQGPDEGGPVRCRRRGQALGPQARQPDPRRRQPNCGRVPAEVT